MKPVRFAACWPPPPCSLAGAASAQTELTLSTPDPDTSEITVAANKFAELVAEKTGGEVTLKVFPERNALWRRSVGGGEAARRRLARHAAALHLALRQLQSEVHGDLHPLSFRRYRPAAGLPPGRSRQRAARRSRRHRHQGPQPLAAPVPADHQFQAADRGTRGSRGAEAPRAQQPALGGVLRQARRRADADGLRGGLQRPAAQGRRRPGKPDQRPGQRQVLRGADLRIAHQPHRRRLGPGRSTRPSTTR